MFEAEEVVGRNVTVTYLRTMVDAPGDGSEITLSVYGGHVAPPSKVEFEVKAEHECPEGGDGELSIGVEPEWSESATETEGSIE
ncbi:amphi-Trp domain-containing protein [Haloarcula argentinensis]|uniref:amphi-Trp domain-containing protein n=1 Tax=Haloarcula argentinensis TaxID=43776 RepID=UPI00166DA7CC|nr:amphi-Trp domain-containing protein [Haloarcula argentinensis]